MLRKIKILFNILPYIFHTIYFNFHYLPFNQAIYLPVLLYKPKLHKLKGGIRIETDKIKIGMIQLGKPIVPIYPLSGIILQIEGQIIFKGKCVIGNNSAMSVSSTGKVVFGDDFSATSSLKLVCCKEITFGEKVLVGWENLFCDTDFHSMKLLPSEEKKEAYAPIRIGSNNWFAMKCTTLKGSKTPNNIIIGANSFLSKDYTHIGEYCLIAGQPAKFIRGDVYRDAQDDRVIYV